MWVRRKFSFCARTRPCGRGAYTLLRVTARHEAVCIKEYIYLLNLTRNCNWQHKNVSGYFRNSQVTTSIQNQPEQQTDLTPGCSSFVRIVNSTHTDTNTKPSVFSYRLKIADVPSPIHIGK